jgi:G3E family GTPase
MSSSSLVPAPLPPTDADIRPSLTVLSGFWPDTTASVVGTLLEADPTLLVVHHDVSSVRAGTVRRRVRDGTGVLEDVRMDLLHGCLACTLREDILPTLARLARTYPDRDQVLHLPRTLEPESVAAACAHCRIDGTPFADLVRVDSYVTVVDLAEVVDTVVDGAELRSFGLHAADEDDRTLAGVLLRQIEYADTLVLHTPTGTDPLDAQRASALMYRLAPWATYVPVAGAGTDPADLSDQLLGTHRHRPEIPGVLFRGIEGYPLGVHEPHPERTVVSVVFRARRPFHPRRLFDGLRRINAGVVRSRGHIWLASQPDAIVAWEFGGGSLALGALGRWLASIADRQWTHVSTHRRLAASLDWNPYYGDRHHHLVFIGLDLDPAEQHRILTACLLTDAELADGEDAWRAYPDPFAGHFPVADPPVPGGPRT